MKTTIGIPRTLPVHLPIEIINTFILLLKHRTPDTSYQYTLWACSLVSKSFYAATVAHLYEFPHLNNRNFDKFSRTICPPVNSHIRRIGLEHLVKHLDMGKLAYESSKSLTARLLRRTKESLQTFIAPAVSFSVVCLAPLSKCLRLEILDLSSDFYDIDLPSLLHSVGGLEHLHFLSLPKSVWGRPHASRRVHHELKGWPPNLTHLQVNDGLPTNGHDWEVLIRHWPASLNTLSFHGMSDYNSFWVLSETGMSVDTITSLTLGESRHQDPSPVRGILFTFTNLVHLTCPAPSLAYRQELTIGGSGGANHLETLSLVPPLSGSPSSFLDLEQLRSAFDQCPRLRRLEIPEGFLDLDDESALNYLEDLEELIERRGSSSCSSVTATQGDNSDRKPAGIFLERMNNYGR